MSVNNISEEDNARVAGWLTVKLPQIFLVLGGQHHDKALNTQKGQNEQHTGPECEKRVEAHG